MGITPVAHVGVEAEVFLSDINSAGESDGAIDDDDFSVVSEVDSVASHEPTEDVEARWKSFGFAAGFDEGRPEISTEARAADGIDENFDFYAAFCDFDEDVAEGYSGVVGSDDVELDVYVVLGVLDGIEHGGICLVCVDEHLDLVAA